MKILHLDPNHEVLTMAFTEVGYENSFDYTSSKEDIIKIIHHYDGLILRSRFAIDAPFLHAAKNLKCIGRVGAGLENIDVETATSLGITCFNAPLGNSNAVGEHALGMLLSLFNRLNICDNEVRKGIWNREANRGVELEGKTVGIIGHGNMGKSFSKKLSGFDCTVICYDIKENVGNEYAKQVSLETFQTQCDVVSLHVPQTTETIHMIDADFIDSFTKPFYLINTARGKSVVTTDLVDALKSGKILGAGLDVLEFEKSSFENMFMDAHLPIALQELIKMDQVIFSPHVAGWTHESKYKLAAIIANDVIKHLK